MKLSDVNITLEDEKLRKYLTYYFNLIEDIEDTEFQINIIVAAIQHDYKIGIFNLEQRNKIWAAFCDTALNYFKNYP